MLCLDKKISTVTQHATFESFVAFDYFGCKVFVFHANAVRTVSAYHGESVNNQNKSYNLNVETFWFIYLQSFRKETRETIRRIVDAKTRFAIKKYERYAKCGGTEFQREWQNEFENLLQQIGDGMEVSLMFHLQDEMFCINSG